MPKIAKELSPIEVARLKKPGVHAVGNVPGLCLQVTDTGARSWLLRMKVGLRRREFGLGSFPGVTLAIARDKARVLREKVGDGIDPVTERRAARSALAAAEAASVTFEKCARDWAHARESTEGNAKYDAQVLRELERHAFPKIGALIVGDVGTAQVLSVVEPIWDTTPVVARNVRRNIERILSDATTRGYRQGENPARLRGHLDQSLRRRKKAQGNHPSLPVDDLPDFIDELRTAPGIAAKALEFAILTAARSREVRDMEWSEVDLDLGIWTAPAKHMKAGQEHRVPLSERALQLLKAQPRKEEQSLVFPAPRSGGPLSDMTLTAVIRRLNKQRVAANKRPWVDPKQGGREAVPHGFRSTFRVWAKINKFDNDAAEAALAHTEENATVRAYLRTDHLEARVPMMEAWASFCG